MALPLSYISKNSYYTFLDLFGRLSSVQNMMRGSLVITFAATASFTGRPQYVQWCRFINGRLQPAQSVGAWAGLLVPSVLIKLPQALHLQVERTLPEGQAAVHA